MIYLIAIASIYLTVLTVQTILSLTVSLRQINSELNATRRLKNRLHPEVTVEDLDDEESMIYVVFDKEITERIMNNENSSDTLLLTDILDEMDDD
jgi:hypothetical protein